MVKEKRQEVTPPDPKALLKEHAWDKQVQEYIRSIVDQHIKVLKQDYSEIELLKKWKKIAKTAGKKNPGKQDDDGQNDGT